jgi:DNA invertase Pin-like site-specific DNA recombinase
MEGTMDNNQNNKPLRFAPLIRVSTERQEKQGESLRTQKKQLESAIQSLNGAVYKWYEGQEHGTPDYERKILEQLIKDAEKNKFDAIIVTDVSRWSRDNAKSAADLEKLKQFGIRFFVGTQEYDLFNHFNVLILTVGVAMNQFFAKEQAKKSIDNKVERAKQGRPSCGKKPFGRIFDNETATWRVDPEKKKIVEEAARLYLEEDIQFKELGKRYGMNEANLWKVLTKRSGNIWEQTFKVRVQGKEELITVKTPVPSLLAEETIQALQAKCEARRTWEHGTRIFEYLFSGIIFDGEAKSRKNGSNDNIALTGTANRWKKRYYRPFRGKDETMPYYRYMVNADTLERAVMESLLEALSSNHSLLKAAFDGNPVDRHAEKLKKERVKYEIEHKSVERRLLNAETAILTYEKDNIEAFAQRMKSKVKELEKRQEELKSEIQIVNDELKNLPTTQQIIDKRKWMRQQLIQRIKESYFTSGWVLTDLPFKDKQKLVRLIFGGRDEHGKRYGIYVTPIEKKNGPKRYNFEAYGRLGNIDGWLENRTGNFQSFSDNSLYISENPEVAKGAATVVGNGEDSYLLSKRDAHHCVCVH